MQKSGHEVGGEKCMDAGDLQHIIIQIFGETVHRRIPGRPQLIGVMGGALALSAYLEAL